MKKNVVTVIVGVLVLIALCIGAYFANEKNKDRERALEEGAKRLEKVKELTNQSEGFNSSDLPDDSPLKIGVAHVSAESEPEE